jgi:hypothetical protein
VPISPRRVTSWASVPAFGVHMIERPEETVSLDLLAAYAADSLYGVAARIEQVRIVSVGSAE